MIIDRLKFMGLLNRVLPAVNNHSSLPILGCVLLKVESHRITVDATDLGLRSVAWADMETGETWATAIPADFLVKLLNLVEDAKVVLLPKLTEAKDERPGDFTRLEIRYGVKGKAGVAVMAADLYPETQDFEWSEVVEVGGSWLQELDAKIGGAAQVKSDSKWNPVLERVHLGNGGSFALNGVRMSFDSDMAVPGQDLHVLAAALRKAARMMKSEPVIRVQSYGINEPMHVRFLAETGFVVIDTEPVKVPDLSHILKVTTDSGFKISFERAPLISFLKMAAVRVKDVILPICIDSRAGAPVALYLHNAPNLDGSSDPVYGGPLAEQSFFVAVALEQFRSIVDSIEDPVIDVHFLGESKPVRLSGAGNAGRFHVIAPLNAITPREVKVPMPVAVAVAA